MTYDYDLLVIGAGPGGLSAAKRAAKYGTKVAIVEKNGLGGTCANRGCIPKKMLVYAADFASSFQDAVGYGWSEPTSQFDWQRFVTARNRYLQELQRSQAQALQQAKINLIQGQAALINPHTIAVADQKYTADKILIAVGGKAIKPDIPGIEHTLVSDEMFDLPELPRRIGIIGGGYIGVEFGSVLRGFGCEVTIVNRENCILEGFDGDVRETVRQGLLDRGIFSFCNTSPTAINPVADGLQLMLSGGCPETVTVDRVLCATGRAANLEGLGLEAVGVGMDQKAIAVDDDNCTNQPHIFAVGDCTNRKQLTPVAKAAGQAFADTIFGNQPHRVNYDLIPSAVMARPEAASVGMTEAEARAVHGDRVECYRTEFQPLLYSLSDRPGQGLFKLVVQRENDRVLGVHAVGDHVAEIIQMLTLALQKGVTKQELDRTIGIHPTSGEEIFTLD